jgi:hypothetical protein
VAHKVEARTPARMQRVRKRVASIGFAPKITN